MNGFIHCDPHPGNILIRKNENDSQEVILLDHGLYLVSETTTSLFIITGMYFRYLMGKNVEVRLLLANTVFNTNTNIGIILHIILVLLEISKGNVCIFIGVWSGKFLRISCSCIV